MVRMFATAVTAAVVLSSAVGPARSAAATPMTVAVDAREVTRGLLHVHETIPVTPGALTLAFPKWIPGEHSPAGPIANLAGIVVRAGGTRLTWRRDPVALYTFRVTVPAGVSSLDVDFDFLGASTGNYSSARLTSPNILVLTWNKVLLAPDVADYHTLQMTPSLTLPGPDWKYATALTTTSRSGAHLDFATVPESQLVDSPLDAGLNVRAVPLGSIDGAPVELDIFADTPEELAASPATLAKFRRLVTQMGALYGARHFNHYNFLLTVSDVLPGEGVEHHQSSDDGTAGDFLIDPTALANDGDLLPHEFNHSWDGKYRRPADLATPNLQVPMIDDLLWVYEGMTQYYGELQAERSGLWSKAQWLDAQAATYAALDTTTGRLTRPLLDTAVSGPFLYSAPREFESARRSVDFYPEGALMWLEADVTIRRLTHGRRSLDDVARRFFGGHDTGPITVPYRRSDVIAALQAVAPYDWAGFLAQRVDAIAPHPPDPFTPGGWRVTFAPTQSAFAKLQREKRKELDARYSIGIVGRSDGTIVDVIDGLPAAAAGVGPGQKIVGINDRAIGDDAQQTMDNALKAAQRTGSLRLLVLSGDVYRTVTVDYRGGPRFPRLVRRPGTPDLLSVTTKPLPAR